MTEHGGLVLRIERTFDGVGRRPIVATKSKRTRELERMSREGRRAPEACRQSHRRPFGSEVRTSFQGDAPFRSRGASWRASPLPLLYPLGLR